MKAELFCAQNKIEIGAYFNYNWLFQPKHLKSMPKPKPVLNAFTSSQAARIVGMSVHMLNYLARHGYLVPNYGRSGKRGKTRHYSYRDLVIARLVQRLLDAGLELRRLKDGLKKLSKSSHWTEAGFARNVQLLATDGRDLYFVQGRTNVLALTKNGQLAFAFVLDVSAVRRDVEQQLDAEQLQRFSLRNGRLLYA